MKTISVIIPVYNEEAVIGGFLEALLRVLEKTDYKHEVIVVNDGSFDKTGTIIKGFPVTAVNLNKNAGQEAAILAGVKVAGGEGIIVMDGDFQDPPELLPDLLEKWEAGHDLVFAKRTKRSDIWKYYSFLYYRLLKIFYPKISNDCGNFFICRKSLIKSVKTKFLRGHLALKAENVGYITYQRGNRAAGKTSYTPVKRLKLAMAGIMMFRESK